MAEGNDKYEIHRHQKNVEGALRRMQEDPAVCPANKTLISDFTKDRLARGVGKLRMAKVVYCMRFMAGGPEESRPRMLGKRPIPGLGRCP